MSNIVIDRSAIDDGGSALEMGQSRFCNIKHGENISVESILKLFSRQLQKRRLFQLCSSIIDQDLKIT